MGYIRIYLVFLGESWWLWPCRFLDLLPSVIKDKSNLLSFDIQVDLLSLGFILRYFDFGFFFN